MVTWSGSDGRGMKHSGWLIVESFSVRFGLGVLVPDPLWHCGLDGMLVEHLCRGLQVGVNRCTPVGE